MTETLPPHPEVVAVARHGARVRLGDEALAAIQAGRATVERLADAAEPAYGISTGFGALATTHIPPERREQLQRSLVRSHAAGTGPQVEREVVRAMMLLRLRTLASGHTGVRPVVAETLAALLDADITPVVHEYGSLGCSGDLAPLAHVAIALCGEGQVTDPDGRTRPAGEVLAEHGIAPVTLRAKEGLGLINGTDGMLGMLLLALADLRMLVKVADIAAAMSVEGLLGTDKPFAVDLQALRPHPGQAVSAANLRRLLEGSAIVASHDHPGDTRVQDAYSLRCAPQVAGAARDTLDHAAGVADRELASAIDNPVVLDDGRVVSNGNFHGAPVAYALDFLAIPAADLASMSERRTDRFLDVARSHGLPPFLADDPGVDSGHMIAQYAAAGIVSELKRLAVPASVDSIPSSAMQEDHVSMGWHAGRKLRRARRRARRACSRSRCSRPRAASTCAPRSTPHRAPRPRSPRVRGGSPDPVRTASCRGRSRRPSTERHERPAHRRGRGHHRGARPDRVTRRPAGRHRRPRGHDDDHRTEDRPRPARHAADRPRLAAGGRATHAAEQPRPRGGRAPRRVGRVRRDGEGRPRLASFDALVRTLTDLRPDETMLVQSGRPVGVMRTHEWAPRVLIANSNLVPDWATWDEFRRLDALGLTMYGQMTAGSWIYIGTQGILQGTYETFAAVAEKRFGGTLAGTLTVTAGLGGMGGAQPLAVTMNGGAALVVECDPSRIQRRLDTRYLDVAADDLDHAIRLVDEARRERRARSVGVLGNAADLVPELLRRGVEVDVVTDQTSAHDPLAYLPLGIAFEDWHTEREKDPDGFTERARASMATHVEAMVGFLDAGAEVFDYGNSLRGEAQLGGYGRAFAYPGFVPAYIRPLFCEGKGPFRWVALSGDPADIARTDQAILELFPDDEPLGRWIRMAQEKVASRGCRLGSAGSATASGTVPGWRSTSWSPPARCRHRS
jgi:histidine ammonia-lyase